MGVKKSGLRREDLQELPEDYRDPIEAMYHEHERVRSCCEQLVKLAESLSEENASNAAASIRHYLENQLPLHLADEEEDLFPLLRQRCIGNPKILSILELLVKEHQEDIECGRELLDALRSIESGQLPADSKMFAGYVRMFRMLMVRHHTLENNTVLPAAFECLTERDKADLSKRMLKRRNLCIPN